MNSFSVLLYLVRRYLCYTYHVTQIKCCCLFIYIMLFIFHFRKELAPTLFYGVWSRWGATDVATLSLHFILFSASLTAWQNFNPVLLAMLFSQRFFCRPLLLPPCTLPCKIVLASPDDLDTCPNHLNLRFFTVVKISSQGPMACLILSLTASLVM